MNIQDLIPMDELKARDSVKCGGCGAVKSVGCVVCWDCFKRGTVPFKSFQGSYSQWLQVVLQS